MEWGRSSVSSREGADSGSKVEVRCTASLPVNTVKRFSFWFWLPNLQLVYEIVISAPLISGRLTTGGSILAFNSTLQPAVGNLQWSLKPHQCHLLNIFATFHYRICSSLSSLDSLSERKHFVCAPSRRLTPWLLCFYLHLLCTPKERQGAVKEHFMGTCRTLPCCITQCDALATWDKPCTVLWCMFVCWRQRQWTFFTLWVCGQVAVKIKEESLIQ